MSMDFAIRRPPPTLTKWIPTEQQEWPSDQNEFTKKRREGRIRRIEDGQFL